MATVGKASPKELEGARKRMTRLRREAKAAGLCIICWKEPVRPGNSTGPDCWERINEYNRRTKKKEEEKRARMMA